jgi:hypothetical protein
MPEEWDEWGRASINSPVTIVEGRGGIERGCGPTLTLQQVTDYVLRQLGQQGAWAESNGTWPWSGSGYPGPGPYPPWPGPGIPYPGGTPGFGPNMSWAVVQAAANAPLKAIGSVILDSMYILTYGIICKVLDAGTGTVTLTITYYDVLTGTTTLTIDVPLTATGQAIGGPTPIFILGGSTVTVSTNNSGTYGTAQYDAFVGLDRVA